MIWNNILFGFLIFVFGSNIHTPQEIQCDLCAGYLQGDPLKSTPPKFLSTRSHQNWPRIFLSARSYKAILSLEKLGGVDFSGTPCKGL